MSPSVRHLSVPCDHRGGVFGYDHHDEVRNVEVEHIRCMCGETLSLGPANDGRGSDFTIKMEIRAAALAAMAPGEHARSDEWAGWDAYDSGGDVPHAADGDEAQCWHTGYLARCIVTHGQEER